MRAAILENLNQLKVKSVDDPCVNEDSLIVKVKSCAVCGSDIRIYHYGNPRVKTPQIIGHEIAGDVIKTGSGVKRFKIGDRVAIGGDVPCGECDFCRDGIGNNCANNYAIGYQFQGGFAEYIPINKITLMFGPIHHIPEELSYDEAALAEPLACCINGLELARINLGDTIVIIGAGPIGCMLAELAKHMGAKKVILSEQSKIRADIAKSFNMNVIMPSSELEFRAQVMKETKEAGADVVITACASVNAQLQAFSVIKNRGRIHFFGGLPKGSKHIELDSNLIHYKELCILGSHGSVPRQHRLALELLENGIIDAKKYISHKFKLEDILDAFSMVENKQSMKVIINP